METHITKINLLFIFLFGSCYLYSQVENMKLVKDFKNKTTKFKALTLDIKKTTYLYNSFDLTKNIDTIIRYEKYICTRIGNNLTYYKEINNKNEKYNAMYLNDSNIYEIYTKNIDSISLSDAKYFVFEDCFLFLGRTNDTLFYEKKDTINKINRNGFSIHHRFETEHGQGITYRKYLFNSHGFISQFETFLDQKYLVPKFYTMKIYSNIKYYRDIPSWINLKFIKEKSKINELLISKKKSQDTIPKQFYNIEHPKTQIKTNKYLYKNNEIFSFDSIIQNNKITIVYFWYFGCKPCQLIRPELESIYRENNLRGINIIGLDGIDEKSFIDTFKNGFIDFYDKEKISNQLQIDGYPTLIILNSNNEIIAKMVGFDSTGINAMRNHIELLIKE